MGIFSGKSQAGVEVGVADNKGSHGRDNKIRMYEPLRLSGRLGQGVDKNKGLEVVGELDVNSLNFCRFSIASAPISGKGKGKEAEGVLVVPSLLDSEYVRPSPHMGSTRLISRRTSTTFHHSSDFIHHSVMSPPSKPQGLVRRVRVSSCRYIAPSQLDPKRRKD
jgi:hypothetical protein